MTLRAQPITLDLAGTDVQTWGFGVSVPGVTTPEVAPGGAFTSDFVVPDPGTHWFHAGRLRIRNMTMMSHPLRVDGHTFQLGPAGGAGPRKGMMLLPPMGGVSVDLAATNLGA
jgi:FtsP/CotA-like multicopper oxidase with cupredoxin domain